MTGESLIQQEGSREDPTRSPSRGIKKVVSISGDTNSPLPGDQHPAVSEGVDLPIGGSIASQALVIGYRVAIAVYVCN
jgi:hypothetical protein